MMAKSTPAGERTVTLDVSLIGRDYTFACKENEKEDLLSAVAHIDNRMREIRQTGKVAGTERIAVMTALNLANDLLRERKTKSAPAPVAHSAATPPQPIDAATARRRIVAMQFAIDQVMAGQEKQA
jgi:cell division protein ZapA